MSEVQKPSEKILNNDFDGKEIVDKKGRKLVLRKPDILDLYDLMSSLGEDAKNPTCQSMAVNVLYIATIDKMVVSSPKSYREFRATLQRIGQDGIQALSEYMVSLGDPEIEGSEKGPLDKAKK